MWREAGRQGGSPPEGACPAPPWGWAHLGSHSSRALRVSSGDLVAFLVHLSRLAILCTCVSTAAWKWGRVNTRQPHWARLPIPARGSQRGWVGGPHGSFPAPPPPASEEGPELQRLPGPVPGQGLEPDPEVLAFYTRVQQCLLALAVGARLDGSSSARRDSTCHCTIRDGAVSAARTAAAVVHLAAAPAPRGAWLGHLLGGAPSPHQMRSLSPPRVVSAQEKARKRVPAAAHFSAASCLEKGSALPQQL